MICLEAGLRVVALGVSVLTLAWEHSVEKVRWQETWSLQHNTFILVQAEIEGTGAGMEPPLEAQFVEGRWVWSGMRVPFLTLRRSGAVPDYTLCAGALCQSLEKWGAGQDDPVRLRACGDYAKEPVQGGRNRSR